MEPMLSSAPQVSQKPLPDYSVLISQAWASVQTNLALMMALSLAYFAAYAFFNIVPLLGSFLVMMLYPGYLISLQKLKKTGTVEYSDFFWGFQNLNRALNILLLTTIKTVLVVIGFIFFIIPGVHLLVSFCLSDFSFIKNKEDALISMKQSREMVRGRWWYFAGLLLVMLGIYMLGALALGIGLLIAQPVISFMFIHLFDHIKAETNPAADF
jgi:uncharacterized membrane protein